MIKDNLGIKPIKNRLDKSRDLACKEYYRATNTLSKIEWDRFSICSHKINDMCTVFSLRSRPNGKSYACSYSATGIDKLSQSHVGLIQKISMNSMNKFM